VSVLAAALVLADLAVFPYAPSAADSSNRAYATLAELPPGRILELPVFRPEIHLGSVYQAYALQTARERPSGYSTVADLDADRTARRLQPLNCGDWRNGQQALLRRIGVSVVLVHAGLFEANRSVPPARAFAEWQLSRHGWRPLVRDGGVTLWVRGRSRIGAPPRAAALSCGGRPVWAHRRGAWRLGPGSN
jgi:hypothetical protein